MTGRTQRQLFRRTQQQLAMWYTGVMGSILALGGVVLYEVAIHAHRMTLDREVRSVAATIHASLEPLLIQPGIVSPEARRFLPEYCDRERCLGEEPQGFPLTRWGYYARLHNSSGMVVAISGREPDLPTKDVHDGVWIIDRQGERFYQTAIALNTQGGSAWGMLYVGRSICIWDAYLSTVRWSLVVGLQWVGYWWAVRAGG